MLGIASMRVYKRNTLLLTYRREEQEQHRLRAPNPSALMSYCYRTPFAYVPLTCQGAYPLRVRVGVLYFVPVHKPVQPIPSYVVEVITTLEYL